MGADIEIKNIKNICNEESGDILVRSSNLNGVDIPEDIIPNIIDEIPILSIAAAFAEGTTNIKNAAELRVKESDRINAIAEGLKKLNINYEVFDEDDNLIEDENKAQKKLITSLDRYQKIAEQFRGFTSKTGKKEREKITKQLEKNLLKINFIIKIFGTV